MASSKVVTRVKALQNRIIRDCQAQENLLLNNFMKTDFTCKNKISNSSNHSSKPIQIRDIRLANRSLLQSPASSSLTSKRLLPIFCNQLKTVKTYRRLRCGTEAICSYAKMEILWYFKGSQFNKNINKKIF